MRTIFKYNFAIVDRQTIRIPAQHKIVHVGRDPRGFTCLWVEVNAHDELTECEVAIIGTGNGIPTGFEHVGSFVDGRFVWHIYIRR